MESEVTEGLGCVALVCRDPARITVVLDVLACKIFLATNQISPGDLVLLNDESVDEPDLFRRRSPGKK